MDLKTTPLAKAALLRVIIACVALATTGANAAEFARVDKDSSGRPRALQIATRSYAPAEPGGGYTVDLIGAVHIADRRYYKQLNEHFQRYDALLFELVIADAAAAAQSAETGHSLLSRLQIDMKDALGLAFQLEEIDYGAANFVHADFSADMLWQSMEERGESLYVYFWRLFYAAIADYARDPLGLQSLQLLTQLATESDDDAFKIAIAYELVKAAQAGDILGSDQGSAIIVARNEHALAVLQEQIAAGAKRIGIFYGAAHMVDFDERLRRELKLTAVGEEWTDAWLFGETVSSREAAAN